MLYDDVSKKPYFSCNIECRPSFDALSFNRVLIKFRPSRFFLGKHRNIVLEELLAPPAWICSSHLQTECMACMFLPGR